MKVMIVDDDSDMRALLNYKLGERGHTVTECADAETAWNQSQHNPYALVVLDWLLPGMNGLELCGRLRALPSGQDSVILIVTGRDQPEDLQLVLEAGADDYIAKPVSLDQLDVRFAIAERQVSDRRQRREAEESLKAFADTLKDRTEELHAALEREKELSELKSRFVSMASHEFRTPLTTIRVGCDLLKKYDEKMTVEQKNTRLQKIQSATDHMTQMLEDILIIGKSEAGKLLYSPNSINLREFCQDIVDDVSLTDNSHSIQSAFQNCDVSVWIDEKLMRNCLTNLLSNALKYSPESQVIDFKVIHLEDVVTFQVTDYGIGIPADDQPHLFEPFHRAENVGNIPGTGLGLAIVKKSVDLHQGELIVDSTPGQGTSVTICLPHITRTGTGL